MTPFDRLASEAATLPHANAPGQGRFRPKHGSADRSPPITIAPRPALTPARSNPKASRGVNDAWETPG